MYTSILQNKFFFINCRKAPKIKLKKIIYRKINCGKLKRYIYNTFLEQKQNLPFCRLKILTMSVTHQLHIIQSVDFGCG